MTGTIKQNEQQNRPVPLVSVLCRSMNRPELRMALDSIAAQDYPRLQLVLVDATGTGAVQLPELPPTIELIMAGGDRPLNRPQAANAALDHASGDFLLFLDEDDWIAPDHISSLCQYLQAAPDVLAAYSSVQKADPQGQLLEQTFSSGFDRHLLLRDNYIPIHAVLFSRQLLERGCRFDENLAIYEDWDFWQQCARHTDFAHLDRVSAYYRQGGLSETSLAEEAEKYGADSVTGRARIAVLGKWLPSWSAADLNAVLGTMDKSGFIHELESELRATFRHREQLLRELDSKDGELQRTELQVQDKDKQLADLRTEMQAQLRQRQLRIEQLEAHLLDRETRLNDVLNSSSWRITRPWRWLGRKARALRSPLNKNA